MYDIRTRLQLSSIVPVSLLVITLIKLVTNTNLRPTSFTLFNYSISGYFLLVMNIIMEVILVFLLSVIPLIEQIPVGGE